MRKKRRRRKRRKKRKKRRRRRKGSLKRRAELQSFGCCMTGSSCQRRGRKLEQEQGLEKQD